MRFLKRLTSGAQRSARPTMVGTLLAAALVALVACLFLPMPAQAQVTPTSQQYCLTNGANYIGLLTSTNLTTRPIALRQGKGVALQAILAGTNAACTTNVCLQFQVSADGTNYGNHAPDLVKLWLTPQGTTAVYGYTNLNANFLNNARFMRLYTVTNANLALAGGWWLSNVVAVIAE